jgi:hypothetical protein
MRLRVGLVAEITFAALLLGAFGGCAAPGSSPPSETGPAVLAPAATDPAAARQRAHVVLSAWAEGVAAAGKRDSVTPVGELTGQLGDWEEAVGENNKLALMAGMVLSNGPLSEEQPPDGVVTWPDGTTTKVPLLSATQALVAIAKTTAAPCSDCQPLLVRAPRLTSGPIQTTRGPATAPIWEFPVQRSAVKVTRIAIANPVVATSAGEGDPQLGIRIDGARGTVGGHELTVEFVGAPDPGGKPCGEDYTTEAVESDLAVVVIITRHPMFPPVGEACPAVGARRTATVIMAGPLGDRVVLDLLEGTPVPVVLAP